MYRDRDLYIPELFIELDKEHKKKYQCYKCGKACGLDFRNRHEMLVYNNSDSNDLLVRYFCPDHADENRRLFGEAARCPTCKRDIIHAFFAKGVIKCQNCNRIKHPHNVIHVLKYDSFKQGKIETKEFCYFCRDEAEAYASSFGSNRSCPHCNIDLVLRDNVNDFVSGCNYCNSTGCPKCHGEESSFNSVFCDLCMSWGCIKCWSKNAELINKSAPEGIFDFIKNYKALCSNCMENAKNKLGREHQRITEALDNEIVVQSNGIHGFDVIKDFGRIEIESNPRVYFKEKQYKSMLLKNAIIAGGNAVYRYKFDSSREERDFEDPEDGSIYRKIVTIFTVSGRAVLHRKNNKRR